ncbi:nuclear transport factor 2 family protein [Streptomyces sp. NPDC059352]|uniref:nuclear transport factor 2 family protein n=1 Tax=Streptomyces sp. NPDC059352 TaxID=3346810 RepID=UPI0036873426
MPTVQSDAPATGAQLELRHEVEEFYARHFQAGDGGDAVAWAEGFAVNGSFSSNARPEPVVSRAVILPAVTAMFAARTAEGVQHRHMLTQLTVAPREDGTVLARSYVLVVSTPREGGPSLLASTLVTDVLNREEGALRILSRHVDRDDLPPTSAL